MSEPITDLVVTEIVEPVTKIVAEVVEPIVEIVEPVTEIVEPVVEIVEPIVEIVEPVVEIVEPVVEIVEPVVEHIVKPFPKVISVEQVTERVEQLIIQNVKSKFNNSVEVIPNKKSYFQSLFKMNFL